MPEFESPQAGDEKRSDITAAVASFLPRFPVLNIASTVARSE